MQLDTNLGQTIGRVGENIIIENDKGMRDFSTGGAQGLNKIQLAATIGGQIFNQQDSLAVFNVALNSGIAAKAFWFFPHILHGKMRALGKPCGKRNASGFATSQRIQRLIANIIQNHRCAIIHHGRPHPRK